MSGFTGSNGPGFVGGDMGYGSCSCSYSYDGGNEQQGQDGSGTGSITGSGGQVVGTTRGPDGAVSSTGSVSQMLSSWEVVQQPDGTVLLVEGE